MDSLEVRELHNNLLRVSPKEFEEVVAEIWTSMGWDVKVTTSSNDRGVDIVATKSSIHDEKAVIQAKRYKPSNKIGRPDIQQYDTLRRQDNSVDFVIVVTTSEFTKQAKQLANDLNVKLVAGGMLAEAAIEHLTQSELSKYIDVSTKSEDNSEKVSEENNTPAKKENNTDQTDVKLWKCSVDDSISVLAADDDAVYVGSDMSVYALDASSGDIDWSFDTDDKINNSLIVNDGIVYVGSADSNIYALNAANGRENWRYQTNNPVRSSPAVLDNTVYIGSFDQHLYALDTANGNVRWSYKTEGQVSSVCADNDTVYFGNSMGSLYALDAISGDISWKYTTDDQFDSAPVVVNNRVYIGSHDLVNSGFGNLHAIDADTGEEYWSHRTSSTIFSSPAVTDDTVYFDVSGDRLYALDSDSGSEYWSVETGNFTSQSPAVSDDSIYIGSANQLFALDAANGDLSWSYQIDSQCISPVVVGDIVCTGSKDGVVYAFDENK